MREGRCQVISVIDNIEWVPIVAVSLALMLSAALTWWVVKQDELRTPGVRDVIVASAHCTAALGRRRSVGRISSAGDVAPLVWAAGAGQQVSGGAAAGSLVRSIWWSG